MPSVEVFWKGRCVDHQMQQDLCEHLIKLSELSDQKYEEYFGKQMHAVLFDPNERETKYLISGSLFSENESLAHLQKVDNGVFLTQDIGLFGVEFSLYDPRCDRYPFGVSYSNRLSIVFTRSQVPELDGRLIQTYSVNKQHRLSELSELALDNPRLDLRYYLEEWMALFLGWVKHFYLPDMYYWLGSDYKDYHNYIDANAGDEFCEWVFNELLLGFRREADNFTHWMRSYEESEKQSQA